MIQAVRKKTIFGKQKAAKMDREKSIYRVTIAGSIVNLLLLTFKFVAGILGHSAAMLADAVHSLSDFMTDIVVILFVNISNKPEDEDHRYGHGKYETLGTAIIGLVLMGVGLGICWNGISAIVAMLRGTTPEPPDMLALWAALLSVALKEALYQYTYRKGKQLNAPVVVANAWHHRSDALSSIGTAAGIGGAILLGGQWAILDPIAAVIVSFFIMQVAWKLLQPSIDELTEKSLPRDVEQQIVDIIASFPSVREPHHLRTRRIGNRYAIEAHMRMNGNITLREAHDQTRLIEQKIRDTFGADTHITLHVEPVK